MTYTSGSIYDGDWEDGMRRGEGKMKWASGDVYEVSATIIIVLHLLMWIIGTHCHDSYLLLQGEF